MRSIRNIAFRRHPREGSLLDPVSDLARPRFLPASWDLAPSRLDHTIAATRLFPGCSYKTGPCAALPLVRILSLSDPYTKRLEKFGIASSHTALALPKLFIPMHNI